MTKNTIVLLLTFFFSLERVHSQTFTAPDPNVPGGSIVEVSTLDINGLPTISVVESIPAAGVPAIPGAPTTAPGATSTSISNSATTSKTTSPAQAQAPPVPGPVGAPPPTIPVGEGTTLFTFTTVVDGETEILTGTFTPTFNTLSLPPPPTSGTVLGLSQFQSQFGTAGVSSAQSPRRLGFTTSNTITIFTILCGVTAGALLTM